MLRGTPSNDARKQHKTHSWHGNTTPSVNQPTSTHPSAEDSNNHSEAARPYGGPVSEAEQKPKACYGRRGGGGGRVILFRGSDIQKLTVFHSLSAPLGLVVVVHIILVGYRWHRTNLGS